MTTRRKIEVGADGMADVLVLTDPIPRHLSIVSWGANDLPATSWKSAGGESPQEVLRTFPAEAVDIKGLNLQRVQAFVAETLDAWSASVASVLKNPLRAMDRAAQVQALTAQAGARVAAFSTAISPILASVTKTYKTAGLVLPDPPTSSTLQGELDRRQFMAGMETASGAITDQVLSLMRDSGSFASTTEAILSLFGQVGGSFARWASSMPDGVVGVVTPDVAEKASGRTDDSGLIPHNHTYSTNATSTGSTREMGNSQGHSHPVVAGTIYTGMGGDPSHFHAIGDSLARGLKSAVKTATPDQSKLSQVLELLQSLTAETTTSTEKVAMNFTIADLQKLAEENPVGFVTALKTALDSTESKAPELTKKFMWGDTGVDQHDPSSILGMLNGMQSGSVLAGLIASAVSGIDIMSGVPETDNVQVAATMRSGIVKHVTETIKADPKGELAEAVKAALAPDIAEAVAASMKAVLNGMSQDSGGNGTPFGLGGFETDPDADPFKPQYPGMQGGNFNRS